MTPLIRINGTTDKLTLTNWFAGDANKIEQLVFVDGANDSEWFGERKAA